MSDDHVMLTIRLPESQRQQFQHALKKKGVTATDYIRTAIKELVTEESDEVPPPQFMSPIALARDIISGVTLPHVSTQIPFNRERDYEWYLTILAEAVLKQDKILMKVKSAVFEKLEVAIPNV